MLDVRDLQVEEAALTGESVPAAKATGELPQDTPLAERTSMAFAGTAVTYGQARGVVVAIGDATETGKIADLMARTHQLATPLTRRIAGLSRLLVWSILALAAALFALEVTRGASAVATFDAAVALAVGAIPEGLPAAVTILLAVGVSTMARRGALIRRLPAVETLGSTTVICSDKTGTLTENQMTVTALVVGATRFDVTGIGYAAVGAIVRDGAPVELAADSPVREALLAGALCNDARLVETDAGVGLEGDPTEAALLVAARKAGLDDAALSSLPRLDVVPFESQHMYMASLHRRGDGGVVYVKGSSEALLSRCVDRLAEDGALIAAHAARFPTDGALQWLAHINRGAVAHSGHDLDRARDLYHRALAVTEGPTALELARTRINLGLLEYDARDFERALTSYRAGVAEASAALGEGHPLVAQLVTYEVNALESLGRYTEAQERLESTDSGANVWSQILRSRLDARRRRFAAAQASASRALAATDASDVLTGINAEAALADALTDPGAALAHIDSMLARCEATYGEQHPITAAFQRRAAGALLRFARAAEALPLLRRSLATCQQHDPVVANTAESHRLIADAHLALGEPDEALGSARAAVTLLAASPGDHILDLALARRALGRAHLARGEADAAVTVLQSALTTTEPRLDADDPDLAQTRVELARALLAANPGNAAKARPLLAHARDVFTRLGEPFAAERLAAAD